MTDAEAKMCLERIYDINIEQNRIKHLLRKIGEHERLKNIGRWLWMPVLAFVGSIWIDLLWYIFIVASAIYLVIVIVNLICFISEKSEVSRRGGIDQIRMKREILEKERNQLIGVLKKSYPFSVYVSNNALVEIINFMNRGCGYEKAVARYEGAQEARERMERNLSEREYRQSILNEQRRINENLENLQREQKYANRLAREAEFRRESEELKRRIEKKWGE